MCETQFQQFEILTESVSTQFTPGRKNSLIIHQFLLPFQKALGKQI